MNDELNAPYVTRPPTELERRIATALGLNPDLASPYEMDMNYAILLLSGGFGITRATNYYWLELDGSIQREVKGELALCKAICELWLEVNKA